MHLYNKSESFPLERVTFSYEQGFYRGRGLLEWNPDEGFTLHAFVDRSGPPLPRAMGFGAPRVIGREDRHLIKMVIQGSGDRARVVNVPLVNRIDLFDHEQLSIRFSTLILSSASFLDADSETVGGEAIYGGFQSRPILPDPVHKTRRLKGSPPSLGWSLTGISFGDSVGAVVRGELPDDGFLRIQWKLSPRYRKLGKWWKWPEAFGDALSLLTGQEVQVRESRSSNRYRTRRWVTKAHEGTSLGFLKPFRNQLVDKDDLRRLTRFFYKDRLEADVARRIHKQLVEAARQVTWTATELLTATILEAALRKLENEPFLPGQPNQFRAGKALSRFSQRYLTSDWTDRCNEIYKAWRRLRHRNAHPDWMGHLQRDKQGNRQAIRDMSLLAQFYGKMILALAGKTSMNPNEISRIT